MSLTCDYCHSPLPVTEAVEFSERGAVRPMHRDCYVKRWNAIRRVINAKASEMERLIGATRNEARREAAIALGYKNYNSFMSLKLEDTLSSEIVRKAQALLSSGVEKKKIKALHIAARSFGFEDWHDFCRSQENRV